MTINSPWDSDATAAPLLDHYSDYQVKIILSENSTVLGYKEKHQTDPESPQGE